MSQRSYVRLILLTCISLSPALAPVLRSQEPQFTENDREDGDQREATEEESKLQELEFEIRSTHDERTRVQRRLIHLDQRLRLLRDSKRIRQTLESLERELEAAEEQGDEPPQELEERFEAAMIQLEENSVGLEIHEYKSEIAELRNAFSEADLQGEKANFDVIDSKLAEATKLVQQLFESLRNGNEQEFERREYRIEEMHHEFELHREILHLKLERHHAEEEGEDALVEDLNRELRELNRELGDLNRESRGTDHDLDDEDKHDLGMQLPTPVTVDAETVLAAANWTYDEHIKPILKRHCHDCHSEESPSGDLNLIALASDRPWVIHRRQWQNVSQQIRMRTMPPSDAEPMSDADRLVVAGFLQQQIDNFDYETVRQPGYEHVRRLTHAEYNHTIRDLFGIDLRPADRFPRELTASSGFANSANSLFLQPVLLERYVGAAERVIQAAMPPKADTQELDEVRRRLVGSRTAADAIEVFTTRAFRRPLQANELNPLVQYYTQLTDQPAATVAGTDVSIKALGKVFEVVLASPSFLFRNEKNRSSQSGQAFRISDHELANRLSYFLWASMPDEQLFQTATSGTLHEPQVLAAEVDRMLADPKANTLGELFAAQWLGFSALPHAPRDPIDNPWATDSLVQALQKESALFFSSLLRDNQPIERLIDAEYTYVNEELAKHYDIDGIRGSEMRRVSLESSPRSGILGQGSILAITSFPNRTSPVVRGNWILTELLGTPPPPPPPNVSEFDDRVAERRGLSQRQKLELHRNNPNCYACHAQIDPLGFALEQYDWFGRYQPRRRGKQADVRGTLPGGTQFQGLKGLQNALLSERRDPLVEQITRKMMTYALGRQLEYFDESVIADIIQQVEDNDRRMQSLVHAIVTSDTFQMKQLSR